MSAEKPVHVFREIIIRIPRRFHPASVAARARIRPRGRVRRDRTGHVRDRHALDPARSVLAAAHRPDRAEPTLGARGVADGRDFRSQRKGRPRAARRGPARRSHALDATRRGEPHRGGRERRRAGGVEARRAAVHRPDSDGRRDIRGRAEDNRAGSLDQNQRRRPETPGTVMRHRVVITVAWTLRRRAKGEGDRAVHVDARQGQHAATRGTHRVRRRGVNRRALRSRHRHRPDRVGEGEGDEAARARRDVARHSRVREGLQRRRRFAAVHDARDQAAAGRGQAPAEHRRNGRAIRRHIRCNQRPLDAPLRRVGEVAADDARLWRPGRRREVHGSLQEDPDTRRGSPRIPRGNHALHVGKRAAAASRDGAQRPKRARHRRAATARSAKHSGSTGGFR